MRADRCSKDKVEEVKWRRRQGALMKGAVCAKTEW